MKLCFETSRLLDASGRIQRQKLVPEEYWEESNKLLIIDNKLSFHSADTNFDTNVAVEFI
jgi:hypothetical protein